MKQAMAAVLMAVAMTFGPWAGAQDKAGDVTNADALRAAVRADKKAYVGSMLALTNDEAKTFWPLYDTYQRALDVANRRRTLAVEALVTLDRPPSDLYARNLANELIAADELELKARRTLHNRVMRALPPRKAARYLQLESKIRAVQAYDIAMTIPLIK
jgi:hypothetical protein